MERLSPLADRKLDLSKVKEAAVVDQLLEWAQEKSNPDAASSGCAPPRSDCWLLLSGAPLGHTKGPGALDVVRPWGHHNAAKCPRVAEPRWLPRKRQAQGQTLPVCPAGICCAP